MMSAYKKITHFGLLLFAIISAPAFGQSTIKQDAVAIAKQKQLYFNYTQCFGAFVQYHFILDHKVESISNDDGVFFWVRAMVSLAPNLGRDVGADADMAADVNDFRREALGDADALADAEKIISFCDKWRLEFPQDQSASTP